MTTRRERALALAMEGEELVFVNGHDDALRGVTSIDGETRAVYSVGVILQTLVNRDGMSHEEAMEFFDFNIEGSYIGFAGPLFVTELG